MGHLGLVLRVGSTWNNRPGDFDYTCLLLYQFPMHSLYLSPLVPSLHATSKWNHCWSGFYICHYLAPGQYIDNLREASKFLFSLSSFILDLKRLLELCKHSYFGAGAQDTVCTLKLRVTHQLTVQKAVSKGDHSSPWSGGDIFRLAEQCYGNVLKLA